MKDGIDVALGKLHNDHCGCSHPSAPNCIANWRDHSAMRAAVAAGVELAAQVTCQWLNTVACGEAKEALQENLERIYDLIGKSLPTQTYRDGPP